MNYKVFTAIACGILFFVMGKFSITDYLGIKRILQFLLITPITIYAINSLYKNPRILLNIYTLFLITYFLTSAVHSIKLNEAVLLIFSLAAIIALQGSKNNFIYAGKTIVKLSYYFSLLACLHFTLLLFYPELAPYGVVVMTEQGLENKEFNILTLLGFVTGEERYFFGFQITRIRSFASEPSILLLFFYFPMCLSAILSKKIFNKETITIGLACILSISGSLYLSFALSIIFFLILKKLISKKYSHKLVTGFIATSTLFIIFFSLNPDAVNIFTSLGEVNDAFGKNRSFSSRNEGITESLNIALKSPIGSAQNSNTPGPIILNAIPSSGWIGGILIFIIIFRILKNINFFMVKRDYNFSSTASSSLLLGGLFVVSTFSDYGMTGYSGIIILFTIDRALLK